MSIVFNCPKLADPPPDIVTINNANSLKLNVYDTTPGTVVYVNCLGFPEYVLLGPSTLKCLPNGTWNNTVPTCFPERHLLTTTTITTDTVTEEIIDSDISMLPIISVAVLLALIIFVLMILVMCTLRYRKKPKSSSSNTSTITDRNRNKPRTLSEPNHYIRSQSMFDNRTYPEWETASVTDFDTLGIDNNYDYIYNGSSVKAINHHRSNRHFNCYANIPQREVAPIPITSFS